MEKFQKLSRAEMKNVLGGKAASSGEASICTYTYHEHGRTYTSSQSFQTDSETAQGAADDACMAQGVACVDVDCQPYNA